MRKKSIQIVLDTECNFNAERRLLCLSISDAARCTKSCRKEGTEVWAAPNPSDFFALIPKMSQTDCDRLLTSISSSRKQVYYSNQIVCMMMRLWWRCGAATQKERKKGRKKERKSTSHWIAHCYHVENQCM